MFVLHIFFRGGVQGFIKIYPFIIIETVVYVIHKGFRNLIFRTDVFEHLLNSFYQKRFGIDFEVKVLRQSKFVRKTSHQAGIKLIDSTDIQRRVVMENIIQNFFGPKMNIFQCKMIAIVLQFFPDVNQVLIVFIARDREFF